MDDINFLPVWIQNDSLENIRLIPNAAMLLQITQYNQRAASPVPPLHEVTIKPGEIVKLPCSECFYIGYTTSGRPGKFTKGFSRESVVELTLKTKYDNQNKLKIVTQ